MTSALKQLLQKHCNASVAEREKSEFFEMLIKGFLQNSPTYASQKVGS